MIRSKSLTKILITIISCLIVMALVMAITGAWYNIKRKASGTMRMANGIVIDYSGFALNSSQTTWEDGIQLQLFDSAVYGNTLPGSVVPISAAQIKKNTSSIDFYARVKLTYTFNGQDLTNNVAAENITGFDASQLISTPDLFSNEWVSGNNNDGWFYYATGTSLNEFSSNFVNLFNTNAKFVIENDNFVAENNGEGGGHVVTILGVDYAIRQIIATLTIETVQVANNAISTFTDWILNGPPQNTSYNLILNLDGAALSGANASTVWNNSNYTELENAGGTITLPDASEISKSGFTFAGWYNNDTFSGSPITTVPDSDISENINVYAKWIENTYTDSFGAVYTYDAINEYYVVSDLNSLAEDDYYVCASINGVDVKKFGAGCASSCQATGLILQFTTIDQLLVDSLSELGDIPLFVIDTYAYLIDDYENNYGVDPGKITTYEQ